MPLVNIYLKENEIENSMTPLITDLKIYLADKLSCADIKLTPEEISIRFLRVTGGQMIGEVEVEITAHAFSERVQNQDNICLEVMKFIQDKVSSIKNVKVWLKLCELGHSW